jgi:hypothetical protein
MKISIRLVAAVWASACTSAFAVCSPEEGRWLIEGLGYDVQTAYKFCMATPAGSTSKAHAGAGATKHDAPPDLATPKAGAAAPNPVANSGHPPASPATIGVTAESFADLIVRAKSEIDNGPNPKAKERVQHALEKLERETKAIPLSTLGSGPQAMNANAPQGKAIPQNAADAFKALEGELKNAAADPCGVVSLPADKTARLSKGAQEVLHKMKTDGKPANANCVQNSDSGASALPTIKLSGSSNSTQATLHIATAYMPIFRDTPCLGKNDWCKMLGFDISATAPLKSSSSTATPPSTTGSTTVATGTSNDTTTTQTLRNYGKQAILSLDGGIFNFYTAFTGGRNTEFGPYANVWGQSAAAKGNANANAAAESDTNANAAAESDTNAKANQKVNLNPRVTTFDHIYWTPAVPDPMEGLWYFKQGVGIRGVKTALDGNGTAGLGTAYFGIGFDGPLFSDAASRDRDARMGWLMVEGFGTGNLINRGTMKTLFGGLPSRSGFFSLGVKAKIGLPGKFFITAEYAKAYGNYERKNIGDMALVSVGYNNDDSVKTPSPVSNGH